MNALFSSHSIYISCCTNFQYNFVTCSRNLCVYVHEIFLNEINNIFDFSASFHCHLILCPAQMFSTDGRGETSINQYLERGEKKWSSAKKWLLCSVAEPGKLILSGDDLSFRKSDSCCRETTYQVETDKVIYQQFWSPSKMIITPSTSFFRCYIWAASPLVFPNREMAMLYFPFFVCLFLVCLCCVAAWSFSSLPPDIQRQMTLVL